jgi:hypothetical protein
MQMVAVMNQTALVGGMNIPLGSGRVKVKFGAWDRQVSDDVTETGSPVVLVLLKN